MGLLAGTKWDRPPHCVRCDLPELECQCPPLPPEMTWLPPQKQTARLQVENRKKGKVVTVVRGLSPRETDFTALLGKLKQTCGAGGTIAEEALEIQGDHLSRVKTLLAEMGYKVR